MHPFFYVVITIGATVAGQLLLKLGMSQVGEVPQDPGRILSFLMGAFLNLRVVTALFLAFVASLGWMAAVSRLPLSYVYPFMAITFPLVLLFSRLMFAEQISALRWTGIFVIWLGVLLVSRG
jgi:multidrug transporter EmrE-like cation transporter